MKESEPPPVGVSRAFSWKKGLLHALLGLVLCILVMAIVLATGAVDDEEAFGRGVGRLGVFVLLAGLGLSWLHQTGRRRSARLALTTIAVGLAALVATAVLVGSRTRGSHTLSEAERRPLEVVEEGGTRLLRHPTLGFTLLHPGLEFEPLTGSEAARFEAQLARMPELHAYPYTDTTTGRALLVAFSKGVESRAAFEGVADGFRDAVAGQMALEVLADEVIWGAERREALFQGRLANGLYITARTVAVTLGAEATGYAVMLVGLAPSPDALGPVLDSFRIPGEAAP